MKANVRGIISDYELSFMLKSEDKQMNIIAEYVIRSYISNDIHKFHNKYNIQIENEQEIIETAIEEYIQQIKNRYD